MTVWIKIDNVMPENPKVLRVGPAYAFGYVGALCFSSRHRSDGFVPTACVARLVDGIDDPDDMAHRLTAAGLWVPKDDGFQIRDYTEHQTSASRIDDKQEANRRRQAAWRERQRRDKP